MTAPHPRPSPGPDEGEFWDWCRARELRIQRCVDCGAWRHHPRPRCPECRSPRAEFAAVSGRGTVHSYTICHPPVLPAFEDKVPYNVVIVRLAEGPFMVSNLIDCPNEEIEVDMPVEVALTEIEDDLVLPLFRRAQ